MSNARAHQREERARLIAGIAGAIVVVAFVAMCIVIDLRRGDAPARVRVLAVESNKLGSRRSFTAEIENSGDHTAELIVVRGEIADEDPVDRDIDFLAPEEREAISFLAPEATSESDVKISVLAWTEAD